MTNPAIAGSAEYFGAPGLKSKPEKSELKSGANEDQSLRCQLIDEESNKDFVSPLIQDITHEPFFHGCVAVEDTVECLTEDGDFLLRTPYDSPDSRFADKPTPSLFISVFWKGRVHHLPVNFTRSTEGQVSVSVGPVTSKNSIRELLKEHTSTSIESNILLVKHAKRAKWQLPPQSVTMDEKIGEGAFGTVWKGKLKDEKLGNKSVAIKVTKETDATKRDEILIEARVMRNFQHINVVQFYGVLLDSTQVIIVMELIEGGSLDNYIKKNEKISSNDRTSFCYDIACGLGYLHSKHFLHRDVASRNCLVDRASNTAKLSDFGMSKQGVTYKITSNERTPIRWQAPEVIKTAIYTIKCDVYSYGMIMYEIFSGGKIPFDGIDKAVIRQKINDPKFRPKTSKDWPVEVRTVMTFCWHADPGQRPSMSAVSAVIKPFSKKAKKNPEKSKRRAVNSKSRVKHLTTEKSKSSVWK